MRAARATDLARATPRPTGGDGDGPLADGRTPVECRTHCASSTGRQRRLARVEPVGRGGAQVPACERPTDYIKYGSLVSMTLNPTHESIPLDSMCAT